MSATRVMAASAVVVPIKTVTESPIFCPCQPVVVVQHGATEVAGVVNVALDTVGAVVALKPGVGGVHVASQGRVAVEVVVVVVPPAVTTVATVAAVAPAVGSPAVPQISKPRTTDTDCASQVVVVTVIIVVVVLVV